jgi:hypothetical protein
MNADVVAARRARLAELEGALAKLRGQYDVLMSRFKFEEARQIAMRIETAERERASLAEMLPPLPAEPPAPVVRRVRLPIRRRR